MPYIHPHNVFRDVAEPPRPQTFASVRIRVLKPFFVLRRLVTAGEVISLPEPDANDLVARGRAEQI